MRFTKMVCNRHDILVIDGITQPLNPDDVAVALLCDRRIGIGADALTIVTPSVGAAALIATYNADGSHDSLSGDALRCAAKFLFDNRLVSSTALDIDTADGVKQVLVTPSQSAEAYSVTCDLGVPRMLTSPIYNPFLGLECVALGERYLIMEDEKLYGAPVDTLGQKLAHDPSVEGGIDVCFVSVMDPSRIILRIWKHSSGEAHSDGTAAAAAAAAMMKAGKCMSTVTVRMAGGDVTVHCDDSGHLLLTSPVSVAFTGDC